MDPSEQLALAKVTPGGDESWLTPGWLNGSSLSVTDRSSLVDWLLQVVDYLGMSDITLHLAAVTMDRVLQQIDFNSDELQLVGVASLLIAAKVHEDLVPGLDIFLKMAGDVYSKADLARVELEIVLALNWRLKKTTAAEFLHLYCENVGSGRKVVFRLARAILDMTLTQEWYCTITPSKLATSSLMAASVILGNGWPQELATCTGYVVGQLFGHVTPCLKLIGQDLGEGTAEKHSKILTKLEKNIEEHSVKEVIKDYMAVHVRVHKDSSRSCG